jgi:hypothetical protein
MVQICGSDLIPLFSLHSIAKVCAVNDEGESDPMRGKEPADPPPPTPPHWEIICKTEKNWWDKCKPFVEIGGVVLLAAYTCFTVLLYFASKKAAEAAKTAADAAVLQVGIAGKSLDATIGQFHLEQRAWVGISVVDVPKPLPTGRVFEIVNHFSNTGKTPAIRPHAVSEIEFDVPNKVPIYQESDAPEGPPLLPGAELRTTFTVPIITEEIIESIKTRKLLIYNRGAVWYGDIFGNKHVSTFCLSYNPASGAFHADSKIPCGKQEAN